MNKDEIIKKAREGFDSQLHTDQYKKNTRMITILKTNRFHNKIHIEVPILNILFKIEPRILDDFIRKLEELTNIIKTDMTNWKRK